MWPEGRHRELLTSITLVQRGLSLMAAGSRTNSDLGARDAEDRDAAYFRMTTYNVAGKTCKQVAKPSARRENCLLPAEKDPTRIRSSHTLLIPLSVFHLHTALHILTFTAPPSMVHCRPRR